MHRLRLAVLFGGPSPERGISLNSARSVCDHLNSVDLELIYFDRQRRPYHIPRAQLYSNTPDDFDFKLPVSSLLSEDGLQQLLGSVDLAFPVMHGAFGEDGGVQRLIAAADCPLVGSPAEVCERCFDKFEAAAQMRAAGFQVVPRLVLTPDEAGWREAVAHFLQEHGGGRTIVKPARGGSSFGVSMAVDEQEVCLHIEKLWAASYDRVVLEPYLTGVEFTAVVLTDGADQPVCLIPVEIEVRRFSDRSTKSANDAHSHLEYADIDEASAAVSKIYDTRSKYLATNEVTLHCPPRFEPVVTVEIQKLCEEVFRFFNLRDFCRFDGWLLPDGTLCVTDINLISGMEQNSFLFLQGARVGLSHSEILSRILRSACRRYGIDLDGIDLGGIDLDGIDLDGIDLDGIDLDESNFKSRDADSLQSDCNSSNANDLEIKLSTREAQARRRRVNVLFGGASAEREVSVMSGANVWLKLAHSSQYEPHPYLLDPEGVVWELPYSLALSHTVEEIVELCRRPPFANQIERDLRAKVAQRLNISTFEIGNTVEMPQSMMLEQFIAGSELVFIALHGGIGENGDLQEMLEAAGVAYNGSGPAASRLCMDKYKTGEAIAGLSKYGIFTARRLQITSDDVTSRPGDNLENSQGERYESREERLEVQLDEQLTTKLNEQLDEQLNEKLTTKLNEQLNEKLDEKVVLELWERITQTLHVDDVIVKPAGDGCSAGVARLLGPEDLGIYLRYLAQGSSRIPGGALSGGQGIIEMPPGGTARLLFEEFITTDRVRIKDNRINWARVSGWIEITVGVLGKQGSMKAFQPSLTVAESNILSLEEKFQGGMGINITPPPAPFVSAFVIEAARAKVETVANVLGIAGYGRIDAFVNIDTGDIVVIEANTLPGLTPSTVIYQQALAETPPLFPSMFLERIIEIASG